MFPFAATSSEKALSSMSIGIGFSAIFPGLIAVIQQPPTATSPFFSTQAFFFSMGGLLLLPLFSYAAITYLNIYGRVSCCSDTSSSNGTSTHPDDEEFGESSSQSSSKSSSLVIGEGDSLLPASIAKEKWWVWDLAPHITIPLIGEFTLAMLYFCSLGFYPYIVAPFEAEASLLFWIVWLGNAPSAAGRAITLVLVLLVALCLLLQSVSLIISFHVMDFHSL
eukprot:TRINITY_DN12701_c0_g1_i1.p1 TRINITY_DN12701_c0_g1~~TRINITY_DN12701_c0_g1_i1.p1  ORF type:complete len:238 (-),score=33.74 TRINITY_DN12701_c0_g1_i1:8-673(-)